MSTLMRTSGSLQEIFGLNLLPQDSSKVTMKVTFHPIPKFVFGFPPKPTILFVGGVGEEFQEETKELLSIHDEVIAEEADSFRLHTTDPSIGYEYKD